MPPTPSRDRTEQDGASLPRRRFLAKLGAGGVAAAAAVVAGARPASASPTYTEGCCHLVSPLNSSYCFAHYTYIWNCVIGGGSTYTICECCEIYPGHGYSVVSGYQCHLH